MWIICFSNIPLFARSESRHLIGHSGFRGDILPGWWRLPSLRGVVRRCLRPRRRTGSWTDPRGPAARWSSTTRFCRRWRRAGCCRCPQWCTWSWQRNKVGYQWIFMKKLLWSCLWGGMFCRVQYSTVLIIYINRLQAWSKFSWCTSKCQWYPRWLPWRFLPCLRRRPGCGRWSTPGARSRPPPPTPQGVIR